MPMPPLLKDVLEGVLAGALGAARVSRVWGSPRAVILAYHNIVPAGLPPCGDRSLHLPQGEFAAQLDWLGRRCEVVPLASILEAPGRRSVRPRVAITFDDAYQGAVTAGAEELGRRGMPATVFVVPGLLGGRSYWWDEYGGSRPAPEFASLRAHALRALGGEDARIRAWAAAAGWRTVGMPGHATTASEAQLAAAVRRAGITLGAHSWSHPNLATVSGARLDAELTSPLAWLQARFDAVIPWLSYPYGLSRPAVEAAAQRAGYRAALRACGGVVPRAAERPYALPRVNVPASLSANGVALRVGGIVAA